MEVLKYPDTRLFKPCKEVIIFGPELAAILEEMWVTMKKERGMGMAANQVGLEQRMFTMDNEGEKIFLVNPVILKTATHPSDMAEGCLSAPGQMIKLYRPMWVMVKFQDETGKEITRIFSDSRSVCVQHEIEHLDGKSFLQNKTIPKKMRIFLAEKWGIPLL